MNKSEKLLKYFDIKSESIQRINKILKYLELSIIDESTNIDELLSKFGIKENEMEHIIEIIEDNLKSLLISKVQNGCEKSIFEYLEIYGKDRSIY
jgi:hypothetical protein